MSVRQDESEEPRRFSRGGFLGRVGVGAVAIGTSGAFGARSGHRDASGGRTAASRHRRSTSGGSSTAWSRSPTSKRRGLEQALVGLRVTGRVLDAGDELERGPVQLITDPSLSVRNPDNPTHTAWTTFMGQFMDHDMTFDLASPLGRPTAPSRSPNGCSADVRSRLGLRHGAGRPVRSFSTRQTARS